MCAHTKKNNTQTDQFVFIITLLDRRSIKQKSPAQARSSNSKQASKQKKYQIKFDTLNEYHIS